MTPRAIIAAVLIGTAAGAIIGKILVRILDRLDAEARRFYRDAPGPA